MSLVGALRDACALAFWTLVVWEGGPRHHSYAHARWRQWQARAGLRRFFVEGNP
jgi:hypothetical protein